MKFLRWLVDIIFHHKYWDSEPSKFWQTDKWGKVQVATGAGGGSFVYRGPGHPVTRKRCKVCGQMVWSNNPRAVCGRLNCWLKGDSK